MLAYAILIAAVLYAAAIFKISYDKREEFPAVPGNMKVLAVSEFLLFILASLGITDYTMQTILGKRLKIITDDQLPGTLVGCGIVPCAILGFSLLKAGDYADYKTLIICVAMVIVGSVLGSIFAGKLDGKKIKTIIRIALVLSLVFLIIKMIVSEGEVGTASGLSGAKLIIIAVLCFATGFINMFGVPMKPTRTAIFLIAGLSPLATLTLVLVLGSLSQLSGGIEVLRRDNYQRKMVLTAASFGSIGACVGALFAISIPVAVLNIVLIVVMVIAIIIMFRD